MIKIIEKEVKIKEYDVEPKVVTLYYVDKYRKDVVTFENCVFKNATPVVYGASSSSEYRLEYENKELYTYINIYIRVDIKTGIVKDYSDYFFDYEQAVRVHRKLRVEFLKDRIEGWKKYQKELEELENFEKKGERKWYI